MNKKILILIAMVIIGCAGFVGGMQYQKSQAISSFGRRGMQNGQTGQTRPNGAGTRMTGNRPVSGEIVAMDEKTLTLKTQDGSTKIVVFSDSTKVNKTSEGVKSDLQVGQQAMIIGIEGAEGTVTAQSIAIGGNMFGGIPQVKP